MNFFSMHEGDIANFGWHPQPRKKTIPKIKLSQSRPFYPDYFFNPAHFIPTKSSFLTFSSRQDIISRHGKK